MVRRTLVASMVLLGCPGTNAPAGAGAMGGSSGDAPAESGHGTHTTAGQDDGADSTGAGDAEGGSVEHHYFDLPTLVSINDGHFATSLVCAECHSNADGATAMRDTQGTPIGPDTLWKATMMANSTRDPFWWAMVRAETVATPSRAAEIESECLQCHAPMAAIRSDLYGSPLQLADLLDGANDRAQLAMDGVACAACHQIPGGDALGPPPLPADGRMYGPHAAPFTMPMQMRTGFEPVESGHMLESAMCGTCHTLRTEPLAADGTELGGHFSEQGPYLEWRNSAFTTEVGAGPDAQSCQDCHMPARSEAGLDIVTRIARRPMGDDFPPISARSPFGRHVLVGGNTLVLAMLRDFADELHPRGSTAELDATIDRTRQQLQTQTATLAVHDAGRTGDTLVFEVAVHNDVGHKFPTGIPARRAWLRVVVRDAGGKTVFRSGAFNDAGQIVDASDAVLPFELLGGPVEPHHDVIDDARRVAIYESVLQDHDGDPTYRLLRATAYAKDNRLLPRGWRSDGPEAAETASVLGMADPDFVGGSDTVEYRVSAAASDGPYAVEVTLLYQPIAARFAGELFALEAPEIRAFERMWTQSDRSPEVVATAGLELP